MKNRKWFQACMAGVLSAAMLTTNVSVWGAEFSDGTVQEVTEAAIEETVIEETEGVELDEELFVAEEASAAEISINSTYFPDAKFRTYVSEKIDKDGNGKLSSTEILSTTTIDIKGLGISNLKGVERFTALKELFAADNSLNTVDLTKNTKLEVINLNRNNLTTLDLSKCTKMKIIQYAENALTQVTMPYYKYLTKINYINASSNKFKTQTAAGLKYINSKYMPASEEVNVSNNYISTFSCSGFEGIIDLRNNRITTLSRGSYGFQAIAIYLEGRYNTLSKTSSVNFSTIGNRIPQRFSCNDAVKSKVKMVAPSLKLKTVDNSKIVVTVGASSDDASYVLERKTGNGSYRTLKTWAAGELEDPEFGENQFSDTNISENELYTYRLTVSVNVQDGNKNNVAWKSSVEVQESIFTGIPKITSRVSDAKGKATIKWDKVPGADGYAVYYGVNSQARYALTSTTKNYAIKSKLTSGRRYYFRVRAYKLVNGKKKYGPAFSPVKYLNIK